MGAKQDSIGIGSMLTARIEMPPAERHLAVLRGMKVEKDSNGLFIGKRPNAFTNLGLHYVLDRIFNLNTPSASITHLAITDDSQTVTAATLLINPAGGGSNATFKALATGVGATATSRTLETVTASAGFTKTDANFVIAKVGLSTASTDAGDDTVPTVNGIINIIGGTSGTSPYNEPFTIDLTNVSAFNLTFFLDITAQAT
jgi:hypothetical protein